MRLKFTPNPIKKKVKPKSQKELGACEAKVIQKIEKPMKNNPKGTATRLGSMNGIYIGLPLHKTFSSALKSIQPRQNNFPLSQYMYLI